MPIDGFHSVLSNEVLAFVVDGDFQLFYSTVLCKPISVMNESRWSRLVAYLEVSSLAGKYNLLFSEKIRYICVNWLRYYGNTPNLK